MFGRFMRFVASAVLRFFGSDSGDGSDIIILSPKAYSLLEKLRKRDKSQSIGQLLQHSMAVYELFLRHTTESGAEIYLQYPASNRKVRVALYWRDDDSGYGQIIYLDERRPE